MKAMLLAVPAALAVLAIAPGGAAVGGGAARPAPACRISGWSADADPSGLRVRAAPSAKAREVGRLPAFVRDGDGDYGPGFEIDAARDGWLHISDARDAWAPRDRMRPTYRGAGWVHGSRVRTRIEGARGRAAPSPRSALVVDSGAESVSDVGQVTAMLDCAGTVARLAYRIDPAHPVRGARAGVAWFDKVCGEQRTTCGN